MKIDDKFAQNEVLFNNKFNKLDSDNENNEQNNGVNFGDVLKKSLDDANDKMTQADLTTSQFVKGEDVSVDDMMIKSQEASLNLQFLAQTRDKLLDGYNQLIKMQL
jgi:flagellar hook-basal body complex protein FliE